MIDKAATISNTRDFFENRLGSLLSRANCNHADLRSPKFDGMPKTPVKGNSSEDNMMNLEMAKEHLACVWMAINKADPLTRNILNSCYLDQLDNYVVANQLSISYRQLSRLKNVALLDFAIRYKAIGDSYDLTDTNLLIMAD